MDKATGQAKGTAFVEFRSAASARAAAAAADKARESSGPAITVAGRMVGCDLALGADDVRSLAAKNAGGRVDRRNLGLVSSSLLRSLSLSLL